MADVEMMRPRGLLKGWLTALVVAACGGVLLRDGWANVHSAESAWLTAAVVAGAVGFRVGWRSIAKHSAAKVFGYLPRHKQSHGSLVVGALAGTALTNMGLASGQAWPCLVAAFIIGLMFGAAVCVQGMANSLRRLPTPAPSVATDTQGE